MLMVSGAFAAPILYFDIVIDSVSGSAQAQKTGAKSAEVGAAGDVVSMSVWAYVLDMGAGADGFMTAKYGIKSNDANNAPGRLRGNLASTLDSDFDSGTGALAGQNITLDGDTDLDVGGMPTIATTAQGNLMVTPMTDVVPAYNETPDVTGVTIDGNNYVGWKMSTLTFTVSAGQTVDGLLTDVLFMPWNGTATISPLKGKADGVTFNLKGSSTSVAVGSAPVITGVPEPMTLGLLAVGAAALMSRKRRRAA